MIKQSDLRRESLITLAEVPNYVPQRRGRKVHYSTVFRWVTRGARGRVLQSVLFGGIRFTSLEALDRFLDQSVAVRPCILGQDDLSEVNQALDEAGL